MRTGLVTLIALLSLSATLAGCFGKNDEPSGDDNGGTTTPPTATTPTGTTPTSTTRPTNPTGNGTTPPPPPPKPADVNATGTLDIPNGIGSGLPLPENPLPAQAETTFTVANAGWKTFEITITPTRFDTNEVVINVLDPAGGDAGSASITGQPGTPPAAVVLTVTGTTAGDYVIRGSASTLGGATFDLLYTIKY